MNNEFQNLRGKLGNHSKDRDDIIKKMRNNLLQRNNGNNEYTFCYTSQGPTVNINTVDVDGEHGLLAIDGDMDPQGL